MSLNTPTKEDPDGYHRLIGGTVEPGESHLDTIRREVYEELGVSIDDLIFVTTIENTFTIDGEPGHEIVYVYSGRLNPEPAAHGAILTESDGATVPAVWRSISGDGETVPLYPATVEPWILGLADRDC